VLRSTTIALTAAAAIALGAQAAEAYTYYSTMQWGTIGDSNSGYAHGNIQNESFVNLYVGSFQRSGSSAKYNYVEAWPTWYLDGGGTDVGSAHETPRSNLSFNWDWHVLRFGRRGDASKVRANIHACRDISYQPDPCSVMAYPSFSY